MKKLSIVLLALVMVFAFAACGKEEKAPDLSGTWIQTDKDSDSWQEAVIKDDVITINWVTDGGNTKSIYWIGTFKAPTKPADEYSWTSTRDKEATDSALLASSDDTKKFTYKNNKISYKVSALGTETTMVLERKK